MERDSTGTRPRVEPELLWAALERSGFRVPVPPPFVEWFGHTPELARELGELVRDGRKKASAGLPWMWELDGEEPPRPGERAVVVDWDGAPLAVVEITDARIVPFDEVDEAFAREEGEGDGSLGWWRRAHWEYFSRECAEMGREPSATMPVLCWKFRLVHAVPSRPATSRATGET